MPAHETSLSQAEPPPAHWAEDPKSGAHLCLIPCWLGREPVLALFVCDEGPIFLPRQFVAAALWESLEASAGGHAPDSRCSRKPF
jgi:hypothetical protein